MSAAAFEQFKERVLADESLQRRVRDIRDRLEFIDAAAVLAAELGFDVTRDDIETALKLGSQAWIERWI
jgi:hypothetical protein